MDCATALLGVETEALPAFLARRRAIVDRLLEYGVGFVAMDLDDGSLTHDPSDYHWNHHRPQWELMLQVALELERQVLEECGVKVTIRYPVGSLMVP